MVHIFPIPLRKRLFSDWCKIKKNCLPQTPQRKEHVPQTFWKRQIPFKHHRYVWKSDISKWKKTLERGRRQSTGMERGRGNHYKNERSRMWIAKIELTKGM